MQALTIFAAKYLFILGPLLVVAVWLRLSTFERRSLMLRAIAVAVLCIAFVRIGGHEHYDPRPFVLMHVAPLIPHAPNNGFPADHTLIAAGSAFLLLPFSRVAGIIAVIGAILVAWARVATLLHSPIDVIASFVAAGVAIGVARLLVRRKPKTGKSFGDASASKSE